MSGRLCGLKPFDSAERLGRELYGLARETLSYVNVSCRSAQSASRGSARTAAHVMRGAPRLLAAGCCCVTQSASDRHLTMTGALLRF